MYEQLDIFSFLEPQEKLFNPIEDYARHGSGFSGGKQRIVNFFNTNQLSLQATVYSAWRKFRQQRQYD